MREAEPSSGRATARATGAKDRNATSMEVMMENLDSGESSMWNGHYKCLLFLEHRRQRGRDGRVPFICVVSHVKLKGLHIYKENRQGNKYAHVNRMEENLSLQ